MPIKQNSYYADPGLGAGVESLGRALFGDPDSRVKQALAEGQARYYGARSAEAQADAAMKNAANTATAGLGTSIGDALFATAEGPNLDGSSGHMVPRSPDEVRAAMPALINRTAQAYAGKPDAIGQIFRVIGAMSGDDALARQGMVAAGATPGEKFAITPQRADDIRAQGYTDAQTREGMQQAGAMARERVASADRRYGVDVAEGGRMDRRYDTPVNIGEGNTVAFAPGDPRAPQGSSQGEGMGSLFTAPATPRADRFVVSIDKNGNRTYEPVRPGLPAPAPGNGGSVSDVSPNDVKTLDQLVGYLIPEGYDIAPDARNRVLTRASEIYQKSKNAQAAVADAWKETFGDGSNTEGVGNPFKQNRVLPSDPAQPAAPQAGASGAVPPASARKAGQVYQTPKGPMMWTGTGWKPAGA